MNEQDTPLDDAELIRALRRRMLSELQGGSDVTPVVNNVYGGGVSGAMGQAMQGDPENRDDYDYFVDIARRDLPELNPDTGKPVGWEKNVHRYRSKKKAQSQTPAYSVEPSLRD